VEDTPQSDQQSTGRHQGATAPGRQAEAENEVKTCAPRSLITRKYKKGQKPELCPENLRFSANLSVRVGSVSLYFVFYSPAADQILVAFSLDQKNHRQGGCHEM
jgi:hypothetical protein